MPRRPSKAPTDGGKEPADDAPTTSYLDSFLNRITEENDLPGELKTTLKQLRDLDTQAHDIFERMQKQSKNYIARAKRSVQSGQDPDEDLLHKSRKLHRELLEIDEQKLAIATESHRSILAHLQHCETELTSFAHELREKGQLKDPSKVVVNPAGPSGARPLSAAAEAACSASSLTNLAPSLSPAASVALSDAAAFDLGLALSGGGGGGGRRQSRPPAVLCDAADIFPDVPTRPAGGGSHKRGRGRKGSKAGAAAATMAVVDVSLPGFDVLGNGGRGFAVGAFGAGVAFTPPRQEYPDAILPLASKEGSHTPLCGAVPQAPNSILPEKTKVAARMSGGVKGQPDEWILAVVQKYNSGSSKYVVLDVDAGDDPLGLSGGGAKQHTIPARYVIALPTSEPSHYSAYNEFKVGSTVLALYPDTTCFYKAYVHTPPSQLETNAQGRRDYMIEFEDESEITGRSDPIRVPQKYTLRLPP